MNDPAHAMAEHLRYVGFEEADAASLRALLPIAEPHFPRIATAFYERIREHEDAHAVFVDEAQISRLHRSMQGWLARVLSGDYGAAYYADTWRIGVVHVRVGLPQRFMLTAMAQLRLELDHVVDAALVSPEREATRDALSKILDVDLAIMLDSYADALASRLRRVERMIESDGELTNLERRYVSAVEQLPLVVVGLDAEGKIALFNTEAERVTGFARDEVLTDDFTSRFLLPRSRGEFADAIEEVRAGRSSTTAPILDMPIRARSGAERIIRWQFANAPAEGVVFVIGHDRTEERLREERTRRVEKLAAVGTLAAGLAHEIRNPLNGAQLHAEYLARALAKHSATAEMRDAVDVIAEEIQRLATLTTEFLDFARPKPLAIEMVSARALVDRVYLLTVDVARAANVVLELDMPQKDVTFEGDRGRLEQVLLNLVRNAIEALESLGTGKVILRTRRKPKDALFEVEDDGTGFTESSPIFDAFYSTKATGTGLGLAITHRIVSDHGGTIQAKSTPGRTVFTVLVPLRQRERRHDLDA